MRRALFPFQFLPTHRVVELLRGDISQVAVLALKAVLRNRRSLEVAHQQIVFRGHPFAFSSRVSQAGELYLELDVGDPRLGDRLVLEDELRKAGRKIRGISR